MVISQGVGEAVFGVRMMSKLSRMTANGQFCL